MILFKRLDFRKIIIKEVRPWCKDVLILVNDALFKAEGFAFRLKQNLGDGSIDLCSVENKVPWK